MSECLLIIVTPHSIEESLVDWLLERSDLSGFSSIRIDGHGSHQSVLSLAEQVLGRQRKIMFHVHTDCGHIDDLLAAIRRDFSGTSLHYWVMPLVAAGRID